MEETAMYMYSKLIFDYVACAILLIIIASLFVKQLYKSLADKIFMVINIIFLVASLADILMGFMYARLPITRGRQIVAYIFAYIYFTFRVSTIPVYTAYIYAISGTYYRLKNKFVRNIFYFPFYILAIIIFSNVINHKVFTISCETGYSRGPYMSILYGISMLYALFGTFYIITIKKYFTSEKWIALLSMYILLFASAIWQHINSRYLIEMFSSALSLLLIHLFVQRPEKYFDYSTHLESMIAYRELVHNLVLAKRNTAICIIKIENAQDIRRLFNEDRFNSYISECSFKIRSILSKKLKDYQIFYNTIGSINIVFNKEDVDLEKDFAELITMWTDPQNQASYAKHFHVKICFVVFPRDLKDENSLFQFEKDFNEYMKKEQVVLHAGDVINTKNFEIRNNLTHIINHSILDKNFEMYYQPIYNLKNGRFDSAEALIRLNHPKYGFISPGLFIPEAEKRGLILPIGDFVLDEVFKFVSRDLFNKLELSYIELNLSVEQILQSDLTDKIAALETKYCTNPKNINLEITESMTGLNADVAMENINNLVKREYSFSLDDYGTGYSNTMRAYSLPLDIIKIDKSLVDTITTKRGYYIVKGMIEMIHDAGFKVVCEGVETEEQYHLLDSFGCDLIQGYYFAKPMPVNDYVEFLKGKM